MINSDMRTSHGIKRAHLYEVWRGSQSVVYDPITYPALKVILFYDSTIPLADQDGFCTCSKHCSTKQNAKYRKCVKVTVALFESGCIIITGSIMPEDAQVVHGTSSINSRQKAKRRTSPRKILKSSWLASSSVGASQSAA
jgi:hypothetical protein